MDPLYLIGIILLVAVLTPIVGYVTAKLVGFGLRRGGQVFEEFSKKRAKERKHGQADPRETR